MRHSLGIARHFRNYPNISRSFPVQYAARRTAQDGKRSKRERSRVRLSVRLTRLLIARRVAQARLDAELTQQQVADAIGRGQGG